MKRNLLALEEPILAVAKEVFGQLQGVNEFDFKEVSSQFTVKVLMAASAPPPSRWRTRGLSWRGCWAPERR
jgi:hypothetical protein